MDSMFEDKVPGDWLRCNDCLVTPSPLRALQVQYIRGSPLQSRDLSRARLSDAKAVFVLTSQLAEEVGPCEMLWMCGLHCH